MSLALTVLITICCFHVSILFITIIYSLWIINKLQKVSNNSYDDITIFQKVSAVLPIFLYAVIQATNISIIIHCYQLQNWHYFVVHIALLIIDRVESYRGHSPVHTIKHKIILFILNIILNITMYRSLLFNYLTKCNRYQRLEFYDQFIIITSPTLIYSILLYKFLLLQ